MIFATFALGFFCPRHACEERDCGGRCSNETISLRCGPHSKNLAASVTLQLSADEYVCLSSLFQNTMALDRTQLLSDVLLGEHIYL